MRVSSVSGIQLPQTVYQTTNAVVGKGETITLSLPTPFKNPLRTVYKKCNVTTLDPPVNDEEIKYASPHSFPLVSNTIDAIAVLSKSRSTSLSVVRRSIRSFASVVLYSLYSYFTQCLRWWDHPDTINPILFKSICYSPSLFSHAYTPHNIPLIIKDTSYSLNPDQEQFWNAFALFLGSMQKLRPKLLELANKVMAGTVSIASFSDVNLELYAKQLKKAMNVREKLTVIADNRAFTVTYRSPSIGCFQVKTPQAELLVGFSLSPFRRPP